jgi:SecD/SecF fusion protein
MTNNLKWKIVLILVIVALACIFAYPPFDILDKNGNVWMPGRLKLGLDLKGGMHLVLRVDTSKLDEESRKDAAERALEVVRNRIDEFGVSEPSIQLQGRDKILIQLPGITDPERAKEIIGRTALLEFKLVETDPEKRKENPEAYEEKTHDDETLWLEKSTPLTGAEIKTAYMGMDNIGSPDVRLEFKSKGAKIFAKITGDNIGRRLAIVLDGKIHSAPVIKTKIPDGNAQITGQFTAEEATDLAIVLKAGALPAPLVIEEDRTISPSLGKDSIEKGVKAAIVGSILVVAFMAIYYMFAGMVANLALCLNLIILLAALSLFRAALTLPGIAGIALTMGMAVDANVLIFERIREELNIGKTLGAGIIAGYKKAFLTIFDSNLTTLITGIILFYVGTGPVRGFAVTLSIGIIISMFTAIVVTRVVFDLMTLRQKITRLKMLRFIKETHIGFIGKRKLAYALSIIFILLGIGSFFMKGEDGHLGIKKNFGIDFTGGTLQHFRFNVPVEINDIRASLKAIGLGSAIIQQDKNEPRDIIIRSYSEKFEDISRKLKEDFKENSFEIVSTDIVGPAVGKELRFKAIIALLLSLIGIGIYVSYRFEPKFAVGGIVALLHDALVSVGALTLTGREISLPVLAALLTVIGYSINDTIVIFDRIRENMKLKAKPDFASLIDYSINQTLSRTFLTSFTVFLILLALYFLGGEVINDFAFVMLIGVITGTYSTIFIAAPIVVDWPGKKKKRG